MKTTDPQKVRDAFEDEDKKPYQSPRVLASYGKHELEALMQPEGADDGLGCGCGSVS